MNAAQNPDNLNPLTDEELGRLFDPGLDPAERKALVERLKNDPDTAEILALASSEPDSIGLSDATVEKLLVTVKEKIRDTGICPHCAGELVKDAPFCPQCGAQVIGNPLTCMTCGNSVWDGSVYCPRCGSFFQSTEGARAGPIESRWFLLVLGIVSIAAAYFFRPVFMLFLGIGLVSLGAWAGEMWFAWKRLSRRKEAWKDESDAGEKDEAQRKSG